MIDEIAITDLGVIESATLSFSPGFTAVTGETGAGKTMVVTALGLLLGQRSDQGAVRSGASGTVVEGTLTVPDPNGISEILDDVGASLDDGRLILARHVSADGRSRAYAGGRAVPAAALARLGERLVAVHGQSDQVRLASATAQREAVDRFAGEAFARALREYTEAFARYSEVSRRHAELIEHRAARADEASSLRADLDAIAAVAPQPGEDAELADRIARLTHAEELRLGIAEALNAVSGGASSGDSFGEAADAIALVERARKALEQLSSFDPQLEPMLQAVTDTRYALEDAASGLTGYLDGVESDGPAALAAAQQRLADLTALMRRFGPTLEDVLEYDRTGVVRLLELDGDDEQLTALGAEYERLQQDVMTRAADLTARRTEAAARFAAAVTAELAALAMPNARIEVSVSALPELTVTGVDRVEILLAPHPGATARVIGKAASGGELSRIMLAIEVVGAGTDPVGTFVFDEVDAGVGGAAAIEIGRRLAALARTAQIIVVTHLAQVAAFADTQLSVQKNSDGGYTSSSVTALAGHERLTELARMLSGLADSETGLAHAAELIRLAHS